MDCSLTIDRAKVVKNNQNTSWYATFFAIIGYLFNHIFLQFTDYLLLLILMFILLFSQRCWRKQVIGMMNKNPKEDCRIIVLQLIDNQMNRWLNSKGQLLDGDRWAFAFQTVSFRDAFAHVRVEKGLYLFNWLAGMWRRSL